jgi:hypothetical protein
MHLRTCNLLCDSVCIQLHLKVFQIKSVNKVIIITFVVNSYGGSAGIVGFADNIHVLHTGQLNVLIKRVALMLRTRQVAVSRLGKNICHTFF